MSSHDLIIFSINKDNNSHSFSTMSEEPYPKLQTLEAQQNNAKSSKFYYHFMYKAVIVSIFLVIVPLLTSQAPEFVNQNFHSSRSRELLQLIFVGIAVCYGLFSKRSEDSEKKKENSSTFDNAHSYIARLLHVSSVFDDETENLSAFDENNKIQTWNSQCCRSEPMVVVVKEDYVQKEHRKTSSFLGEKPLFSPVRSLNSHVSEPIQNASFSRSFSGSDWLPNNAASSIRPSNFHENMEKNVEKRSGSKRLSMEGKQTRNEESGGLSTIPNMEEMETTEFHRSPIPWRTRSGKMVFEEDINGYFPQNSGEDSDSDKLKSSSLVKSLSSLSARIDSNPPSPNKEASPPLETSPRKVSPSPSWSGEAQEKRIEDFLRKNSFNKSSPPSPPPTEPPYLHKSSLSSSGPTEIINDEINETRELRRRTRSVPMEFTEIKRMEVPRGGNSWPEFRATDYHHDGLNTKKSVGTIRHSETFGKTMRQNEFRKDLNTEEQEKWSKAIEEFFGDKKEFTNKFLHEKFPSQSRQTFVELPEEEDIVDTDEDSETESKDEFFDGNISKEQNSFSQGASEDSNVDGGPDVDKKADEFIAKFRQQIKLQRIQSMRGSC
ncbi:hypothetical protein LIER_41980 [Lithospermum erythrorhizon]|uniref:Uncharacterized protein n=1 Tax=Lithospermum erythrorhizon TaxID=34254 RepID=A0AAV3RKW5_LITER